MYILASFKRSEIYHSYHSSSYRVHWYIPVNKYVPSFVPITDLLYFAGIYATGPFAYLFHGVVEQNYIFHVMD